MPCVFSSSAISTVTPQTIMITRHGIRLIASPSSAAPSSTSTTAPGNAAMPTLTSKNSTLSDQRGDDAEREPVAPVERAVRVGSASSARGRDRRRARANSFSPPNRK